MNVRTRPGRASRWARLLLAFVWTTGIVWASFDMGGSSVRANAPAVTGPLTVTGASGPIAVPVSTPTDPVTVNASSLTLSVSNYYADLDLTVSVTASAGSVAIDGTGLNLTPASPSGTAVTFSGAPGAVVTALQSRLSWTAPQVAGAATLTLEVTSALPSNVRYYSGNGHLYLTDPSVSRNWADANTFVADRTLVPQRWGRPPHLATITSEAENNYLRDQLSGNWWLGGSDAVLEGAWKWIAGPEMDQVIPTTNGNATYTNWSRNCDFFLPNWCQPDNLFGNEHYLEFHGDTDSFWGYSAGTWNDRDSAELNHVLVEYSGDGTVVAPHIDTHVVTFDVRSRFATLIAYADGVTASATPTIADWTQTEVTGTIDATLASALNSVLALPAVTGSAVSTTSAVQTLVDAYRAVLSYAASGGTAPTADHYAALGVTGLDSSAISRLNGLVRGAGVVGVDTANELAALAAQVSASPPPPPIFVPAPAPEPEPDPDEEPEPEPEPELEQHQIFRCLFAQGHQFGRR